MPLIEPVAGRFCWFELGTTDRPSALRFYQQLFGWTAHDQPVGPAGLYTIARLGDQDVAALYELPAEMRQQGVPTAWLIYVAVESADQAAARAAALGGTIVQPPFEAGPNGRMAVLKDPTGAVFAVWQARTHAGVRLVGDPGTVVWADLVTPDQQAAIAFYHALFGWRLVDGKNQPVSTPGRYAHIVNGDTFMGGIPPAHPGRLAYWLLYFDVADCDATLAVVRAQGGRIVREPQALEPVRRFAVAADPQGATFALVEPRQSA